MSVSDLEILSQSVQAAQQGDESANRGDLAGAAKHYRRAFELNPYNDIAIMSYGAALARQGDLRGGIKWVEKAVEINPDNERARQNLKAMKADL